jgi:hypothetical protein
MGVEEEFCTEIDKHTKKETEAEGVREKGAEEIT